MSKYNVSSSLPTNFEGFINARQPQDVFAFFDDFMGCSWALDADSVAGTTTTASNPWQLTDVSTSAATTHACLDATYSTPSTMGGILAITTTVTTDAGVNLQVAGQQFVVDQDIGLPLFFETRFRVTDVSNADVFIGLSKVDVEIITTGLDDGIGFIMKSGVLYATAAESSTEKEVDCGITETDDQWVRARFHFDGGDSVVFSVDSNDDGVFDYVTTLKVSTGIHYLPDDQSLTPTIDVITGTTASAEVVGIDYVYCAQQRYHA